MSDLQKLDNAVYKSLTTPEMRTPDMSGGCFTKGTPVHTREGLRPIEEIKVGDYVLSSPEDGTGQPEYKPVVNTFVFRDKTIKDVGYLETPDAERSYWVNATGDHPFWVEGVGWTRADALKRGDVLRKADGSPGRAHECSPIFRIPEWHECFGIGEGVGWVYDRYDFIEDPKGILFDYENNLNIPDPITHYYEEDMTEENYLKTTVYNIEVADFHTYYVGKTGIWVSSRQGGCVLRRGDKADPQ